MAIAPLFKLLAPKFYIGEEMIRVFYLLYIHVLIFKNKEALRELSEEVGRLLNGYRSAILTSNF